MMDPTTLFKASYGLYVLTAKDDTGHNGCIINTFLQVTSQAPFVGVITVNKAGRTHDMVLATKEFNLSMLDTTTPFDMIQHFGFQSGQTQNKFANYPNQHLSPNGLVYLPQHTNAYLSCQVMDTIDFDTHTMFTVTITHGEHLSSHDSLTYAYYQAHVKPKPQATTQEGYRCNICGYVYEGHPLPSDFICPLCKHGAGDFEKI